jgi:hypothetical protein
LETLTQIESTVYSAAGSSNTQAYLQSLATLNKNEDHSRKSDEVEDFTSRTSFSSLNYLETLSDVPAAKREEMIAPETPKMSETMPSALSLTAGNVETSSKDTIQKSMVSSLQVDVPIALHLTSPEETDPIHPTVAIPFNNMHSTTKRSQAFSPDSTMPSLRNMEPAARPPQKEYSFTNNEAKLFQNDSPTLKDSDLANMTTSPSAEELLARISMAAEYLAAEKIWDAATIKGTSPLTSVTTVLADLNEQNSHVALQTGQDEITKSLIKWIKSTQNHGVPSTTTDNISKETQQLAQSMDMTIRELSERIAQGFFSLGELVVTALNLVAESVGNKSLSVSAKSAQEAATDAIASAVASVMTMVQKVGDVSVADVLQSMVELVLLISRVMFRIFNGALEILSGKSVKQIGQAVTNSFENEAQSLTANKDEFSEKSLYDLVVMLGKFELEAAEAVMATASNVVQSLEVGVLHGPKKASLGI